MAVNVFVLACKAKTLCNCLAISFLLLSRLFRNIGEFGAKKKFTDTRTAKTIQLVAATKGSFSGLFFF